MTGPSCCPSCSADIRPIGPEGLCAHCRKPLPRELLGDWAPPAVAPPPPASFSRVRHYGSLAFVCLLVTALSLFQWGGLFYTIPFLLLSIPLLLSAQIWAGLRLARDPAQAALRRLASVQKGAAVLPLLLFPMFGDDDAFLLILGARKIAGAAADLLVNLSALAALAFLVVTVRLFQTLRKPSVE